MRWLVVGRDVLGMRPGPGGGRPPVPELTWWQVLDLDWEIELLLLDDAPVPAEPDR